MSLKSTVGFSGSVSATSAATLDPMTDVALTATADDLLAHLARLDPHVRAARRLITIDTTADITSDEGR